MASQSTIYLDYAAATPIDEAVVAAMLPYFSDIFYNPSATYQAARTARAALEGARSDVAQCIGSRATEVIFTAGGSEANNMAIHGVMRQFPDANVVVSSIEHDSVLAPAAKYANKLVNVHADGRIDMASLLAQIDDNTVLVSIMYANNEVGTVQPVKDIARAIQHIRAARKSQGNTLPLYLHTDACQASNYLDLHVARLGVDMMTLNGGKIYGPKQTGILYIKAGLVLSAFVDGGGQEFGLRSGTENVAGAVGFATALVAAQANRHDETARLQTIQTYFYQQLGASLPQAVVNGSQKFRLPNNVHITLPGTDNERVLFALDERGILAAAGSACSASDEEPSHVLRAMGISDEYAQASLRLTMGKHTTQGMIDDTVKALVDISNL